MKLPKIPIPKINIDYNNPDEVKKIIVLALAFLFIIILLVATIVDNKEIQDEMQEGLEIEQQSSLSSNLEDTVINFTEEKDTYAIDYPGYKSIDEAELETVIWFIENTDLEEVTIIYGGIGGEKRTYDLTKSETELFGQNPLINAPDSEPLFDGR